MVHDPSGDPPAQALPADDPAAKVHVDRLLSAIAPTPPPVQFPWESARHSPAHRLPVLCNGEASARKDDQGLPVAGTGAKCVHYWSLRRIPESQNSAEVEKGETLRMCRLWRSAEGPMEFDEGRALMANHCDCYEPDGKRPYDPTIEQPPMTLREQEEADAEIVEAPPADPFDPGLPTEADLVQDSVYGVDPAQLTVVKQSPQRRWILHTGDADHPILFVYFRLAFAQEEYAVDRRYPEGDVRRYDRNRLLALELCLEREPLTAEDWPARGARPWRAVLNRPRQTATINDALEG